MRNDMRECSTWLPRPIAVARLGVALFLGLWVTAIDAHEGHLHGTPQAATASDPNAVVREVSNARYEVVLKYRSLAESGRIPVRLYVSDFVTNAPVGRATVTLQTTVPARISTSAKALEPGVYAGELSVSSPGRYTAILSIEGGGAKSEFALSDLPLNEPVVMSQAVAVTTSERRSAWLPWVLGVAAVLAIVGVLALRRTKRRSPGLDAAGLVLIGGALVWALQSGAHEGEDHGSPALGTTQAGGAGPRYVAKESQFLLGVRTFLAEKQRVYSQMTAVGRVTAESGALASVSSPQTGRMERAGRALAVGDRVRKGQLIGYLLMIDRLPIRAPISGLVADVDFAPGQWVQAGQELMRILDERQLRVEVPLFGENLTRALRSRSAVVRTSALPNRLFPARLRGLAPLAGGNDDSREAAGSDAGAPIPPVLLSVTNEGGLLRPGMIVEASLELADSREVITVPEGAIVYQESGPAVFVHTAAELFELRPVALAGRYLDRVGIEGEIHAGERIVSEGAYSLVAAPTATLAPAPAATKAAPAGTRQ
jgi:multidrug efflux pump subunit AcrA (membrane-fusion protein)